jgi:hypothetical protein
MSLAIDVDRVSAVLLADGWHEVAAGSFTLDSYEYVWWPSEQARARGDFDLLHGGGRSGVCATGFQLTSGDDLIAGPLTAILAVRIRPAADLSA